MSGQIAAMGYLSPAQQGILFHSLEAPESGVYLVQSQYRLQGELDVDAFALAWQSAVDRHPILRTAFVWEDVAEPVQVVHEHLEVSLETRDWRDASTAEQERRVADFLEADRRRRLDVGRAPLMRLTLFRMDDRDHLFVWSLHHILLDGWSKVLVLREVLEAYEAFRCGETPQLPSPRPYLDYIGWLRRQDREAAREFWRELLAGYRSPLRLQDGGSPSAAGGFWNLEEELSEETTEALERIARRSRVTLNTLVSVAWGVLLARHGGERDVVFGVVVSGRPATFDGVESMVGMFINTLPMRLRLGTGASLTELLAQIHRQQQGILRHQGSALVDVQGVSEVPRGQPLFESIFAFESFPIDESLKHRDGDLVIRPEPALSSINYPLSGGAFPGRRLRLEVQADRGCFDRTSALRIAGFFVRVLEAMAADPEAPADRLEGLSAAQRHQVSREWSYRGEAASGGTLSELWRAQARERPDAVALVRGACQLTYGEVARRVDRLARGLRSLGVGPEEVVGLEVKRSLEMVVGFLGILGAGGVYLPLDRGYPPERRAWMMADAGARVLLTRPVEPSEPEEGQAELVADLGDGWQARTPAGEGRRSSSPPETLNLAYVIYTSGSTGRPKGVAVSHGEAASHLRGWGRVLGYAPGERTLQFSAMSFDASIEQMLAALGGGATVMVRGEEMWSPREFWHLVAETEVTVVDLPTAYWQELLPVGSEETPTVPSLRWLILGGEALPPATLERWFRRGPRNARLLNSYGPTEAIITATLYESLGSADAAVGHAVSLGRPLAGRRAFVHDALGSLAPLGAPGELCLGGVGLARGYLGDPVSTAERFTPDSHAAEPGARLYRTGDLTRWRVDGRLDFLGRIDDQVKIRGFRIEPGEIESTLLRHPEVAAAVVVVRGGPELMACVVPADGDEKAPLSMDALRRHLAESLPEFMVPAAWVFLADLPLLPSGKVDRRSLAGLEPERGEAGDAAAPRTPTEELLAGTWEEILGVEGVGREDDFFALGGHSLLATRLVSRVARTFEVELPLPRVFELPRLGALAREVEALAATGRRIERPELAPQPRDGPAPLSFAQERLWFLHQMEPGVATYNVPMAVHLEGDLAATALAHAFDEIVRRHEVLRTTFEERGGEVVQRVGPARGRPLPRIDLTALETEHGAREARRGVVRQGRRPFRLTVEPPYRQSLVRRSPDHHLALLTLHHVATDDWSAGVFLRELSTLYDAFRRGRPSALPELSIQYADYALWQRRWLTGRVEEELLDYWRDALEGAPQVLELPTDRPRPKVQRFVGGELHRVFSSGVAEGLRELDRREGVTLFMTLAAIFGLLLHRHSGQDDLLLGAPVAHRIRTELEELIGFFINTLAVRLELAGDPELSTYLARVRERALAAYTHQDLPFEKLVDALAPERDRSRSPIFQVVFQVHNAPRASLELPGLKLRPVGAQAQTAKFDLILNVMETGDGLSVVWRYNRDLFDSTTVRRMAGHFETLVEEAVTDPDRRLSELPWWTRGEHHQILREWTDGIPPLLPASASPLEAFQARCLERPDAVAVVCGARHLSYAELARRSGRLARQLRRLGIERRQVVGLYLERSEETVMAILGVLRAGGAYLPLDRLYPEERVAFALEDSGAPVVWTRRDLIPELPADLETRGLRVACLEHGELEPRTAPEAFETPERASPRDPAYVIYTSGSTGRPKGVVVEHRQVARLLSSTDSWFGFGASDVWTLFHSYAFDFSVWELWGALAHGGRLVVVPREATREPRKLHRILAEERVTVLNQTPSAFRQLLPVDSEAREDLALRWVIFGGEALDPSSLRPWFARHGEDRPMLVNMYGITETTVHVTFRRITQADARAGFGSLIGRAIPDLSLYVVRPHTLTPVVTGVHGELLVGGAGVAQGYLSRPALTAERFVPDPFVGEPGARLYRSGDLVRWRAEGELEYLGRIDHQVKIRGFRLELGEIEARLTSHPAVRQAAVLVRGEGEDRGLVACLVPEDADESPTIDELREFLAASLPEYMVPYGYVLLDTLPLTPNGKVDRQVLLALEPERREEDSVAAPRTPLEEALGTLWQEVLQVEEVGVHDDFFALGGNSLRGVTLINRLQERLGEIVHVVTLFDAPTVAEMAALLEAEYPESAARLGRGRTPRSEPATAPGDDAPAPVDATRVSLFRELTPPLSPEPSPPAEKLAPAVFVLAPPRSGTTLLRVMLGGHSKLFAPPELELLTFRTLAEREAAFGSERDRFWLEGLIRAVMEVEGCSAPEAEASLAELTIRGATTRDVYAWFQARLGERLLVDKTPSYSLRSEVLERMEETFDGAFYIHLTRHPYGMIRSFEEAKLDQIFYRYEHPFGRRELAELIWTVSHRNVSDFLARVPRSRQTWLRFEDLVQEPRQSMERVCALLGLSFEEAMVEPYRHRRARMTDGPRAESRMLGDVKFHRHEGIEARVAERWRESYAKDFLGDVSRRTALGLGYDRGVRSWTSVRPIERRPGEAWPLSFAQQRLWFLDRLEPGSPLYNVPLVMELRGRLEPALLERSLQGVVRRHEALRTVFAAPGGEPRQRILPGLPVPLAKVDLTGLQLEDREPEARRLARWEALRSFDLRSGPLVRSALLRLRQQRHVAFLSLHHIVADGSSMGVLMRDLGASYVALQEGRQPSLPELPVQYVDYAVWQRERLGGGELERQIDYWRERLRDVAVLQLPTDRPRPAVMRHRGASVPVFLPREPTQRLERLGRDRGATLFMVLTAAFHVLLGRLAGQSDVAVGSPLSGRIRPEIEHLIGFFVNTVVVRGDLAASSTFEEHLGRVRETVVGVLAHQDVPFEQVVEELQPVRDLSRSPLFQVAFALQDNEVQPLELSELSLEPLRIGSAVAKFDLFLSLVPPRNGREGLFGAIEYDRDLFDPTTIARWAACLRAVLEAVVEEPARDVGGLPLLSRAERHQLREEWNDTATPYPREATIHGLFDEQAAHRPDAVAVVAESAGVPEHLSYRELERRASQLAHYLGALGVGPETPVGLSLERSVELAEAVLGILKAGGYYVPLDPSYPPSRLELMVVDAGLTLIVSHEACWQSLPAHLAELVLLDGDGDLIAMEREESPRVEWDSRGLAYALYTSGSTGRPKGVRVPHQAVVRLVRNTDFMDFSEREVFLQLAPVPFDLSTLELWGPLLNGGRLVMMPAGPFSLENLGRVLERHQVTSLWLTAGLFHQMVDFQLDRLGGVEQLLAGGDVLSLPHVERVLERFGDRCRMINGYGPTENTTFTSTHEAGTRPMRTSVPIGRPIANTRVRVLDRELKEAPVGTAGELYAAGDGLARDYLSRPALTAERFVPDPAGFGARLYRIGDQVRWLADGNLEFLGRLDHQIKLRGFRIELGEVESVLAEHPQVRETVVVARGEGEDKHLVGYVASSAELGDSALRSYLAERLPPYLIPSRFVVLDELPRTPNAKIDRRALPAPEDATAEERDTLVAPRTDLERELVEMWADLFRRDVETIGVEDSFFDLGGHSLLAVRLFSRIQERYGLELSLPAFFIQPTVEGLAETVDVRLWARRGETEDETDDPDRSTESDVRYEEIEF